MDVLFAKAGSDNYGHMLADVAPKLINLARAELGPVRLHVPEDGRIYLPFLRDLVERLAIDAEFRVAAPEELLRFEQAAFLTPVALHSRRKSAALRELRELLLTAYGTGGSRRLFVTRKPREKRTIANVASVESIFAGCGFEIVHPRRLTIAEQVRLFSQASHIAGPVGAGMANMLFAPNSAEILLIDPGLCDFFFWDAANLIGQPFHWHFASTPGRFDRSLVQRAFQVDGQALLATLRSLGLDRWPKSGAGLATPSVQLALAEIATVTGTTTDLTHLGRAAALFPPRPRRRCSTMCPTRGPGALSGPLRRARIHLALPGHRPARFRPSRHRLCAGRRLVEFKSLKLFLGAFRNHGGFHED